MTKQQRIDTYQKAIEYFSTWKWSLESHDGICDFLIERCGFKHPHIQFPELSLFLEKKYGYNWPISSMGAIDRIWALEFMIAIAKSEQK